MRYRILGPLAIAESPAPVTAARDRAVLAMLLLHADRVLGVGELVDALWGEDPPVTARNQLQTCVSRLRRALPPDAIRTDPAGYRIAVGPGELDAVEFDRLLTAARAAADPELYRQALSLWRGPALAGIESHAVRLAAAALDERRAVAVEDQADLEIAAGRGRELIGGLSTLVDEFPLREHLRGQLMTALYQAGRQADALAEFRRAARVLRDDLGIEPGPALRELHGQILAGRVSEPSAPLVRCLPRTVGDFTGRAEVVRRLVDSIEAADESGPAIAVIDGMAGSGKTTLALHVASLVGDRYPAAHLFVDLHGHSEGAPLDPAAALLILLRQLGLAADQIPHDLVDRVALWRTELARRPALLVLDNASSSVQVADLLPATPGSLALVTSRRRLAGLDGVHPESLAVLPAAEATALLARIAGDRVAAEPDATAEVVRRCGGLPLAIRLAGARLAHRPRWRVADLVRRLGESVLPELAVEDRTVARAFVLSYGQLALPRQQVFRLLGVHPGAHFDDLDVAALTGLPLNDARDALDDLVDTHLVEEPEPQVFRLHDLLREFAAALAVDIPAAERRAAVHGVLDLQLHAAAAATVTRHARDVLQSDLRLTPPLRSDLLSEIRDPTARLERERTQLPALVAAAMAEDLPRYAWQIPRAAWWYLYTSGYDDDLHLLLEEAMAIVERLDDRPALATIANYLAGTLLRLCEDDRARDVLQLAIRLRSEMGLRGEQGTSLGNLASLYESTGRYHECVATARAARRLIARSSDPARGRVPLNQMGTGLMRLGRWSEALRYRRLSLLAAIESDDTTSQAHALSDIQRIQRVRGAISTATAHRYLAAALGLMIRGGNRFGEADIRNELGCLLRAEGRFAEAFDEHRAALETVRVSRHRRDEALFTGEYAASRLAAGDEAEAYELYQRMMLLARRMGRPYLIAIAEAGIADSLADREPEQARKLWENARVTFRELGMPQRFAVEAKLGGADHRR